jgi:PST family polysaccharide transporter
MGKGIKKSFFWGVFYTASAKYMGIFVSLIVTMILARLLPPNDFGIIATAFIFIGFFSIVTTVGIGPAIIQNKELNNENIEDIFSFTLYLGFFLSLSFILITPILMKFYDNNETLRDIFFILSINIFFAIIAIVPNALILKAKEFKFIAIRSICIQISTGILAIIAVINGLGIYALLIAPVIGSILIFIISYIRFPVNVQYSFKWSSLSKIFSFSFLQMSFNIIYLLYRNIDKILIGKFMNMSILGFYEKSYRLMMFPLENISHVINPVLHPLLSDYQNDKALIFYSYKKLIKILAHFGFLLTFFLYFSAEELVILFFGDQWYSSIPVFKILSLSVGIQIVQSPVGSIFQAINYVKGLVFASLIILFLTVIAVSIGIFQGSVENIALYLVITMYAAYFIYNIFLCNYIKINIMEIISILIIPLLLSIGLGIILFIMEYLSDISSNLISISMKFIISLIYVFALIIFSFFDDFPFVAKNRKAILKFILKK